MESSTLGRPLPGRLVGWLVFVLAFAALAYTARLGDEDTPDDVAYRYLASLAAIVQYAIIVGILLLIARGLPKRDAFGLHAPASWGRALGLALLALGAIFAAGVALAPFLDAGEEQGLVPEDWDPSRAGAFAVYCVVVTVLAPVVEELTYRGLGFALLVPYGALLAILLTGVLFSAAHGLLIGFPVLAIFGVVVGWLRWATASIYPPMLLHATFNATALILSLTL